jgi:2,5-furandicarboxylate decarboxylase 1
MAKDLRSFLEQLRARPGSLARVDKPVKPHEFEVTALLKQVEDRRRRPAVLFEHPTDMHGGQSPFRLISNVFADRERCAMALGVDPDTPHYEVSLAFARMAREKIAPTVVPPEAAPVRENVWRGDESDVGRLPIVRHFELDIGPTLTMTHVMRAAEGFYDISFAKTFYKDDPRRMVASLHSRDLSRMVKEHEERNEPAKIINVLGHHPAFYLGSLARNPWGTNDYATLGSFLGEPLRLTPSASWGHEFMVPADAEAIIEGELLPGEKDICDPFGEVARLYQAQCLRPVFHVKAITFRNGAIIQDIFSGFHDSFPLGAILKEATIELALRPRFPKLHQVSAPDSALGVYALYLSIDDPKPGDAEAIGRAALDTYPIVQLAVVVDSALDVFDEDAVFWAIHTYSDLARGIMLHGESPGHNTGPITGPPKRHMGPIAGFATTNWGGRVVIDATRPTDFAFGSRSEVPRDAVARMPLTDYLRE